MGDKIKIEVKLDVNSLVMYIFIIGFIGLGKSNVVYYILDEVIKNKILFLVIELVKGEYRKVFNNIRCFGINLNVSILF